MLATPTNIRVGWKGFLGTNTLAYWADYQAAKNIKGSGYGS
jgi:hypothetical protein